MGRMKMYACLYDNNKRISITTDLFLERNVDFSIFQMIKNQHYLFEKDASSGICFELFFAQLKKEKQSKELSIISEQLLQIITIASPVSFNPNHPSFDHYRTEKTVGIIGLDPVFIFLKQAVNQLVPGVYTAEPDNYLRTPVYFNNKEQNDELTVKTLGQGKYTDIIAQLSRIGLR